MCTLKYEATGEGSSMRTVFTLGLRSACSRLIAMETGALPEPRSHGGSVSDCRNYPVTR